MVPLGERVVVVEEVVEKDPIPDVEWWDKPLLQNGSYDDIADGRWQVGA